MKHFKIATVLIPLTLLKLKDLPPELYQLKQLKYIDISNNEIPNYLLYQYREGFSPTVRIKFH